jgi:glutamine synthetase
MESPPTMSKPTFSQAEYIWIDGAQPTQKLRSKTRIVPATDKPNLELFPEWSFDGSSTYQAGGHDSDCILKPVRFVTDPVRGEGNYLVLCEVYNADATTPHATNKRAELRKVLDAGGSKLDMWVGFEQEYTLFNGSRPLGFPDNGYPAPQGPFYCGVGADEVFGRDMVEAHTKACIDAGIMIYGVNAEVMPGQWEFQIGYRGVSSEPSDPLYVSDHLWLARWVLYRVGEEFGISATLHPKPVRGDWNGAGGHTNFSTKEMREASTGKAAIEKILKALSEKHMEHIDVYGADNSLRLTGHHETCHITQFKHGVADRGCSIRIPRGVANKGYGYLEDRRPAANLCPYTVSARLLKTITGQA